MAYPARLADVGTWEVAETPIPGWGGMLRVLGAGFFHTPLGLEVGAPAGRPLYARYLGAGGLRGVALGVSVSCRLSSRRRHAYFPSWPVFAPDVDRERGLADLAAAFRAEGLAEVAWDSFDAGPAAAGAPSPARFEYVLPLDRVEPTGEWIEGAHHRRSVRRGDRSGITMRVLDGGTAVQALEVVQSQAAARAIQRGAGFAPLVPAMVLTNGSTAPDWGLSTFAAFRGATLLAAILVGRGPDRAYYVLGGATPDGYQAGASVWLHAKVAAACAADGCREYNLGGVPASALTPDDPSHGLHRFKLGFGTRMVPCTGDRWVLRPVHVAGHQVARWAAGMVR